MTRRGVSSLVRLQWWRCVLWTGSCLGAGCRSGPPATVVNTTARNLKRMDECLVCVRWIGQMGSGARDLAAERASLRGTTLAGARAELLSEYHDKHKENDDD